MLHVQNQRRTDVAGHDDQGVAEVHRAALPVGEAAVVQHLQQDIEHVRVGFLDLVEEDHGVGAAAHRFGQLSTFLEAHVSGRGTDQAGHRMFLHVLGHIDAHHRVGTVEQEFGEGFRKFGFPHAARPQEHEAAQRTVGVVEARARAADGVRDADDGPVLTDHALVQLFFQAHQLLAFAFHQFAHGNAGPAAHDGRHIFLGDLGVGKFGVLQLGFHVVNVFFQRGQFAVLQLGGGFQVVIALGPLDLGAHGVQFLALVTQGRHVPPLGFPAAAHLVQLVRNGL